MKFIALITTARAGSRATASMYDQALRTTDISQRKEVWRAREQFFRGDFPCSTLVDVKALAIPALLVEINATGFIGAG